MERAPGAEAVLSSGLQMLNSGFSFFGSPAQFIASPKFFRNSFDVRICPATVTALREKGLARRANLKRDFQISACGDANDRYGCRPEFYGYF